MTDDLIQKIAHIIDPHAFELTSRAHPDWAVEKKKYAIERAEKILAVIREDAAAVSPVAHRA